MLRTIGSFSLVCAVGAWLVVSTRSEAAPDSESTGAERALVSAAKQDLTSKDRLRRLTALRVVAAAADPSARALVEDLYRDRDAATVVEAGHALSRMSGDPAPLVALVDRCGEDAVHALADGFGPKFDAELQKLARSHEPPLAAAALRALATRDARSAVPIVRVALTSVVPQIRVQALHAALRAPDSSFAEALSDLSRSEDATERTLALGALAGGGDADAARRLLAEADRGDGWDRVFVAETAAWAGAPDADGAWRRAVASLRPEDRVAALSRFRGEMPEALRRAFRDFLAAGEPKMRLAAAVTLSFVRDEAGLAALRRGFETSIPSLAADAQVALAGATPVVPREAAPDERSGRTTDADILGRLRAQ